MSTTPNNTQFQSAQLSSIIMDLLREYDFDCLPLIDREYDNPAVQSMVHSLIAAEMRSFAPADYLAYLPNPELKFEKSSALQAEMQRLETAPSSSSGKLNMDRYMADRPTHRQDQDEQAWRAAIDNIQAQLVHQENRLMNAELAEGGLGSLWLQQNATVDQVTKHYSAQTDNLNRQIRETNKARQVMQTRAYPELTKLIHRRDSALQRQWMCQQAYGQVRDQLLANGFDAERTLEERRILAAQEIDHNDAAHNSTVREYERVNESGGDTEVTSGVEGSATKKSRKH